MHRLEQEFQDQVEFVRLDIDDDSTFDLRQEYELFRRTSYHLIDGDGNIVERWIGPLDQATVSAELAEALASLD